MPFEINHTGALVADETPSLHEHSLRSEDVTEIVSSRPSFLIRWGISIFFIILLLIVLAAWFIQYPDTVIANAKLTTINAPKEVRARTAGQLVKLSTREGEQVLEGEILGYIESRASHKEAIALSKKIDELQVALLQNNAGLTQLLSFEPHLNLGEVQQHYQTFIQAVNVLKQYLASGYYIKRRKLLDKDLHYLTKLNDNLGVQLQLQLEDRNLQEETYKANEYLNNEKVISAAEFRLEKSKLISKELSIPQLSTSILNNENSRNEKLKEIIELENQIAQQKEVFVQALNMFKAQLDEWKAKYLLIAPVSGSVAFATFLQEKQQLKADQVLCFINPGNSTYYAEVFIPQSNFGKVKKYQSVLLQLPAYPAQEFGKVEGRLAFISNIPTDSGYLAKVVFSKGMVTNYNKPIQYYEGLTAQAEIITSEMNLLERLFNGIRKILNTG